MRTILLAAFLCSFAFAEQSLIQPKKRPSLWKTSVLTLLTATSADAWSSYGRPEMNPVLNSPGGHFQARSIAIKGAITGAAIGAQYFLLRRHPEAAKYAAGANFALSGMFTAVSLYNRNLARSHPLK